MYALMIDDDIYVLCLIHKQPLQTVQIRQMKLWALVSQIKFYLIQKRKSDELNRETNWNF